MPDRRSNVWRVAASDVQVNSASANSQTGFVFATLLAHFSKLNTCCPPTSAANGEHHQLFTLLTPVFRQNVPRVSSVSVWRPAPAPRKMVPEFSTRPSAGARTVTSFCWKLMTPYLPSVPLAGSSPPVQLAASL